MGARTILSLAALACAAAACGDSSTPAEPDPGGELGGAHASVDGEPTSSAGPERGPDAPAVEADDVPSLEELRASLAEAAERLGVELQPPADPGPWTEEERAFERQLLETDLRDVAPRVRTLRQRLSLVPDDVGLRMELGELFHGREFPRMALRELLLVTLADDRLERAHVLLADLYLFDGDHPRALWHLDRALACGPESTDAFMLLATVLRELWELDLADATLAVGLGMDPFDPPLLVERGALLLDRDDPEAALEVLASAARRDPDNRRVHLLLGRALQELGLDDRADEEFLLHERIQVLHNAGVLGPRGTSQPVEEWLRAALIAAHYMSLERYDRAREELERSYALEPDTLEGRSVEAQLALADGDDARAVELLDGSLARDPEHGRTLRVLAAVLLDAADPAVRDPERAVEVALRAVAVGGQIESRSWLLLARAHEAVGDVDAAVEAYRRVLTLDPAHAQSRSALERLSGDESG